MKKILQIIKTLRWRGKKNPARKLKGYKKVYEKLDSREGEREIYEIAKRNYVPNMDLIIFTMVE